MEEFPEYTEEDLKRFRDRETGRDEEYFCNLVSAVSSSDDRKLKLMKKFLVGILGRRGVYTRVSTSSS